MLSLSNFEKWQNINKGMTVFKSTEIDSVGYPVLHAVLHPNAFLYIYIFNI